MKFDNSLDILAKVFLKIRCPTPILYQIYIFLREISIFLLLQILNCNTIQIIVYKSI